MGNEKAVKREINKLEYSIRALDQEIKIHSFEIQRIFRKRRECYELLEGLSQGRGAANTPKKKGGCIMADPTHE